jgi:hypothetical protein
MTHRRTPLMKTENPLMKTAQALTLAVALASTALLSLPAGAVEVCDKSCVGPACVKDCVREPGVTVGRGDRDRDRDVTIEEREHRRGPDVEIKRERRPGVDVEIGR